MNTKKYGHCPSKSDLILRKNQLGDLSYRFLLSICMVEVGGHEKNCPVCGMAIDWGIVTGHTKALGAG